IEADAAFEAAALLRVGPPPDRRIDGEHLSPTVREHADVRVDRMSHDHVDVGVPLVINVGVLDDSSGTRDHGHGCAAANVNFAQKSRAEHVPCNRVALWPVADVPRDVVEYAGNLVVSGPAGRRLLEDIVALVRIDG